MSGKLSHETTSWFAIALDEIRTRRILREKADCKQSMSPVPLACENIRFSSLFAAGDVSLAAKSEEKRMFSQATVPRSPLGTPRTMADHNLVPRVSHLPRLGGKMRDPGNEVGPTIWGWTHGKKKRPAFLESGSAKASSSNKYPNFSDRHVCLHITTAEFFAQKLIL